MMLSELERTRPSEAALKRMRRASQPNDFSDLPESIRWKALAIVARAEPKHRLCRNPKLCMGVVRTNARRIALLGDEGLSRWSHWARARKAINARKEVIFQRAISASETLSRAGKWTLHRDGSVTLSVPRIKRGTSPAPVSQRETAIEKWSRGLKLTRSGFVDRRAQSVNR